MCLDNKAGKEWRAKKKKGNDFRADFSPPWAILEINRAEVTDSIPVYPVHQIKILKY